MCQKTKDLVILKHPLSVADDDGGGDGRRISWPPPAPFPITPRDSISRSGIPLTPIAGAYGAGAVSGGCFNPAVAFGIDVSSAHLGIGWCVVYTVFELVGAVLAAVLFKVGGADLAK